jgi:hypothetical protein
MLTANTITDQQIHELLAITQDGEVRIAAERALLPIGHAVRLWGRARCAEILNARISTQGISMNESPK